MPVARRVEAADLPGADDDQRAPGRGRLLGGGRDGGEREKAGEAEGTAQDTAQGGVQGAAARPEHEHHAEGGSTDRLQKRAATPPVTRRGVPGLA